MKRNSYLPIVAAVLLAAACATQKGAQKNGLTKDGKPGAAGAAEGAPAAPPTDVTEASLRTGGDFAVREDLKSVPFDYDSAKLSDEALTILKANAEVIKGEDGLVVLVAGHCDERGTVAYNLALGQKRAKEVRDYYINLGIDGTRIATISYGKEQPVCSDSNDDCWSKNRRAETRAHVKK
jgi:peptidoglycan-associated lipoprotein